MTLNDLISEFGYWKSHPIFTLEDWKYEVANDDTRLGYWEWVWQNMEIVEGR